MPYKKSRFNFTYRQSEDAYVVFNTYSKALVVLSSAEFEQFNAQHFDDAQMVRELADNGILVDETFDEIGFMTYCHNRLWCFSIRELFHDRIRHNKHFILPF